MAMHDVAAILTVLHQKVSKFLTSNGSECQRACGHRTRGRQRLPAPRCCTPRAAWPCLAMLVHAVEFCFITLSRSVQRTR